MRQRLNIPMFLWPPSSSHALRALTISVVAALGLLIGSNTVRAQGLDRDVRLLSFNHGLTKPSPLRLSSCAALPCREALEIHGRSPSRQSSPPPVFDAKGGRWHGVWMGALIGGAIGLTGGMIADATQKGPVKIYGLAPTVGLVGGTASGALIGAIVVHTQSRP